MGFLLLCPVSDTPLMRFVRFAGTGLFLKSLTFQFSKTSQAKSPLSPPHFCTSYLPLTHSSRTSHAIAPLLLAFSPTLFVALPRGRLGPPWARLGAIFAPCWGHIEPSSGRLQVFWGSSWGLPGRADISFRTARPKHTSTTHIQTMCPKETTYPYVTKVSLRAMQQQAWISFGGRPTSM